MAFLHQEQGDSVKALTHKMAAIRLVNESLNDPLKAVSDENLSAVMRLLTFEVRNRNTSFSALMRPLLICCHRDIGEQKMHGCFIEKVLSRCSKSEAE
jgi:hypothetical protein